MFMKTIVTHNGSFDPDDVLAVAALQLYLGEDNTKIIRSREQKVIDKADYVVDVGLVYDPTKQRFDHHQEGVPTRENGVPYSSFGLVWKEYGVEISGSSEVAAEIDRRLAQPIDAADNHVTVCHPGQAGVEAVEFYDIVDVYRPIHGTDEDYDSQFLSVVNLARILLRRFVLLGKANKELHELIQERYSAQTDKAVMVFDEPVSRFELTRYPEVQVIVCPHTGRLGYWMASVVPVKPRSFQNRVLFPERWAGLGDEELESESKIVGAVFCTKDRYAFVANSRESALKAAHHAHV